MENDGAPREDRWSEALAVGSLAFVERVKNDLGVKAAHRKVLAGEEKRGQGGEKGTGYFSRCQLQ